MRRKIVVLWATVQVGVAFGQADSTPPVFEVASVKQAAPQGSLVMIPRGGPGTPDPENVRYTNVSLALIIINAWDIKRDRINGPTWLDSERYDITAKVPPGTSVERFKLMFQNLLAERFHLSVHHEFRDTPVYNLIVAASGPRLKESPGDPGALNQFGNAPRGGLPVDRNGFPQLSPGVAGMVGQRKNGVSRTTARGQPISSLVQLLSTRLGEAVVDKTGLGSLYDFDMEFSTDGLLMVPGVPYPPSDADSDGGPSIFEAVQRLGLKLDKGRAALDTLIIDHLDKAPTEN